MITVPQDGSKRALGKFERRERLYEAALALFRDQGYEETTVDQITRRAGLAKGTFFNYFPTKDAVLRYMGTREVGRLGAAVLTTSNSAGTSLEKLKRLMAGLASSLERDRTLVRLIFRKGMSVADLMTNDAGGFSLQAMAALLIRQAQRSGEINPKLDADTLAAALDVLYLRQLVRWCEADEPNPLGERLTVLVDQLLGATQQGA